MSATDLARAVGVSHVSVLNWENGRNTPKPSSMAKLVRFFENPQQKIQVGVPERVVMAAFELAEWALAPAALPNERLATDEDLASLRTLLDELPADVAKALRKLGGFALPKKRRRSRRRANFGLDYYRLTKVAGDNGNQVLAEMGYPDPAVAVESMPLFDFEGNSSVRDLAVRLGIPVPRILNDGWWDAMIDDDDDDAGQRRLIAQSTAYYWMRDLNFTEESLAEDMGVALEEVTAVFDYRAEPTMLWFDRWQRATGVSHRVINWPFIPPWVPGPLELRISTFREHVLDRENDRLPAFRRMLPEDYARILRIGVEELRCILEGESMATTLLCQRVLRGLSISSENGVMVKAVSADRRIPIRA